jgi:hypothetical protein
MKMTRKRKTAVVIIVLVVAGFAGCFVSALKRGRFAARQTMCVHNLKLLGLPLKMYADEHDGAFPDKWSTLTSDPDFFDYDMFEVFVCPMHSKRYEKEHGVPLTVTGPEDVDERSSYVLVPGLTTRTRSWPTRKVITTAVSDIAFCISTLVADGIHRRINLDRPNVLSGNRSIVALGLLGEEFHTSNTCGLK